MRIQNIDIKLPEKIPPEAVAEFRVTVFYLKSDFHEQALGSSDGVGMKVTVADGFDTIKFDIINGGDDVVRSISGSPADFVTEDALTQYIEICDAYFRATKELGPAYIEKIDVARSGLHNQGAENLLDHLTEQGFEDLVDFETARRLFTLIVVSYMQSDASQKSELEAKQDRDDGLVLGKH